MNFSSITFIGIFSPIIICLYFLPIVNNIKKKNIFLLIISLLFYTCVEPIYIFLFVTSILLNYYAVVLDLKLDKRVFGNTIIALDVLTLLCFKYINSALACFSVIDSTFVAIAFPIGLSFYTFKEISFVVESRKNSNMAKHLNLLNASLYISNFITLVAGPIGFYDCEIEQIKERKVIKDNIYRGVFRFAVGLIKKVLLADSLKLLVDACFSFNELSVAMSWIGAIAYALQIFMDFSGYTDMAIGLGLIFGFNFPENFNFPYLAKSITDFWKRWHMSLTKWLTRYVYIPLGGSRVNSVVRHLINLFVVWICTGIWHGSNWTFIIWGMVYFLLQIIEKYTSFVEFINKIHLGHIYTLVVVTVCWVIFRSDSVGLALSYISTMFGVNDAPLVDSEFFCQLRYYIIPLLASIALSISIPDKFEQIFKKHYFLSVLTQICVFVLFVASIFVLFSRGFSAPIYANF